MQLNEQVIRNFAHQIWESEGKPEGQAKRHWEMACKLAEGETGPADPLEPLSTPATTKKSKSTKAADKDSIKQEATSPGPFGPAEHEVTMAAADPNIAPPPTRVRVQAVVDDPAAAPKKRPAKAEKQPKPH